MDSLQDDNNWIRHAARAIALVTGSNEEETIAAIIEQHATREPFLTADAASLESITREVAKRIERDVRHHKNRRVWLLGRVT